MQFSLPVERVSQMQVRRAALVPLGVLGLLIIAGLGLVGFRGIEATGAFNVDRVQVDGAGSIAGTVRKTAFATVGDTSMLSVNPAAISMAIASIPRVKTAYVDRGFPNTLTIKVVPERAVAIAPAPASCANWSHRAPTARRARARSASSSPAAKRTRR